MKLSMKRFFKITLGLVFILFIAVVGLALSFNPNEYKGDIVNLVKEKTGRNLSAPGDISLSLFPWIGIDLGAIEISNAKGFGKQPFAKMTHLQVRVKFWPLFKQRFEIDTIVIEGLQLNLAKNKQGISNWHDLTKSTSQATTKSNIKKQDKKTPKVNNKKDTNKTLLAAIALNGIKIKDAEFNWHDQQQNKKLSVKNVQV
jgi:AsmA protein